jgi:pyridoxamine 5'-phosphate oxidase
MTPDTDTKTNTDPLELFHQWLSEAEAGEPNDPNAMALATVDARGRPSVRMVLLKGADPRGFTFYTNLESRKGQELRASPWAALCFHWKSLKRQIRVEGPVEPVSEAEAEAYFRSRARGSQLGAWASQQSRPLPGRWELERRVAEFTVKFGFGAVPRPPHWSGFRLVPEAIEFWRDRPFRLHERQVYHREPGPDPDGPPLWRSERLYP